MKTFRLVCKMLWVNLGMYCGLSLLIGISVCLSPFLCFWAVRKEGMERRVALQIIIWRHGRAWTGLVRLLTRVRCRICVDSVPEPCILVANHQSFFDPYCFAFFPVKRIVFVVRDWPFRLPVYGFFMKQAGYLNSERLRGEELLREAAGRLRQGSSVMFFPEGTRSAGGALGRFHAGAFLLAARTGVPVVPICIDGTGRMLPKHARLLRPEPLSVTLLPPVCPDEFAGHGEEGYRFLRRRVKEHLRLALSAPS